MKKIVLIFSLLFSLMQSSTLDIEKKIYTKLFTDIFKDQQHIKVWSDDDKKREIFKTIKGVELVDNIDKADILMVFKSYNLTNKKIKFLGTYTLLKHYQTDALGGFFWQKGRPNIVFLQQNLINYGIKLSDKFKKYIRKTL